MVIKDICGFTVAVNIGLKWFWVTGLPHQPFQKEEGKEETQHEK